MKTRALLALLASLAFAEALSAQTKTNGTLQCSKADPMNAVEVGDHPGHLFYVAKQACTWTKPMEMAGASTKDGGSVAAGEIRGGKSSDSGAHWSSMSNGDKIFVSYHGTTTMDKDGHPQSSRGHWAYTGGTGKLKGVSGKGTYAGKANSDGSMTYEIEGDYKVPAAK